MIKSAAVSFLGGLLLYSAGVGVASIIEGRSEEPIHFSPELAEGVRVERILVLFTSSSCSISRSDEFVALFHEGFERFMGEAQDSDSAVRTVGVAFDQSPDIGIAHLKGLARFDEIVVGNGWLNVMGGMLGERHSAALPVTPLVLIFERDVTVSEALIGSTGLRLVASYEGMLEIGHWMNP